MINTDHPYTRFGLPQTQTYLLNEQYGILYGHLIGGPLCAFGRITEFSQTILADRSNSFRPDYRLDPEFRLDLKDYVGSGYDRGHLWNSADSRASDEVNSQSFLLSNMSPQLPEFNRGIWKTLEGRIRDLASQDDILTVDVQCGPWWHDTSAKDVEIQWMGDELGKRALIPHGFWKAVCSESTTGRLKMWAFIFENKDCTEDLTTYQVAPQDITLLSGFKVFDRLHGLDRLKSRKAKCWW